MACVGTHAFLTVSSASCTGSSLVDVTARPHFLAICCLGGRKALWVPTERQPRMEKAPQTSVTEGQAIAGRPRRWAAASCQRGCRAQGQVSPASRPRATALAWGPPQQSTWKSSPWLAGGGGACERGRERGLGADSSDTSRPRWLAQGLASHLQALEGSIPSLPLALSGQPVAISLWSPAALTETSRPVHPRFQPWFLIARV